MSIFHRKHYPCYYWLRFRNPGRDPGLDVRLLLSRIGVDAEESNRDDLICFLLGIRGSQIGDRGSSRCHGLWFAHTKSAVAGAVVALFEIGNKI